MDPHAHAYTQMIVRHLLILFTVLLTDAMWGFFHKLPSLLPAFLFARLLGSSGF